MCDSHSKKIDEQETLYAVLTAKMGNRKDT